MVIGINNGIFWGIPVQVENESHLIVLTFEFFSIGTYILHKRKSFVNTPFVILIVEYVDLIHYL